MLLDIVVDAVATHVLTSYDSLLSLSIERRSAGLGFDGMVIWIFPPALCILNVLLAAAAAFPPRPLERA